jgi:hypothetical protein
MNNNILVIDKPKYILVKKSPINQKPILESKYILVKKSPINQKPILEPKRKSILEPKRKPILEPKEQNNGKIFKYDREMYDNFPLFNL